MWGNRKWRNIENDDEIWEWTKPRELATGHPNNANKSITLNWVIRHLGMCVESSGWVCICRAFSLSDLYCIYPLFLSICLGMFFRICGIIVFSNLRVYLLKYFFFRIGEIINNLESRSYKIPLKLWKKFIRESSNTKYM